MNEMTHPSLNNKLDGLVFESQPECPPINVDHQILEVATVDLISKLENILAKAHDMANDDFIDASAEIAQKMIEPLEAFNKEYLHDAAAKQAQVETNRAIGFADTYQAVLKTRSWTNAVIRAFWNVEENKDILVAHADLGGALVRACATTFYHAVKMIGLDHDFGKEIDKSTVVFVNELQENWK